uniref:Uncharacterized protein n=1 Tax=Oryza punctata TaxID=4537 RepID=A0A0G2KBQ1_ORYPU
MIAISVKE